MHTWSSIEDYKVSPPIIRPARAGRAASVVSSARATSSLMRSHPELAEDPGEADMSASMVPGIGAIFGG